MGVMGRSLNRFELIESYPEDKYHPSYLVWGSDGSRIFHVVFAVDMKMDNVRAVTAYFPELGKLGVQFQTKEESMNCHVCGGLMEAQVTDLSFKLDQHTIRIIKELPVLECKQCGETLIEAQVMAQVEPLLGTEGRASELEVMRYAA